MASLFSSLSESFLIYSLIIITTFLHFYSFESCFTSKFNCLRKVILWVCRVFLVTDCPLVLFYSSKFFLLDIRGIWFPFLLSARLLRAHFLDHSLRATIAFLWHLTRSLLADHLRDTTPWGPPSCGPPFCWFPWSMAILTILLLIGSLVLTRLNQLKIGEIGRLWGRWHRPKATSVSTNNPPTAVPVHHLGPRLRTAIFL